MKKNIKFLLLMLVILLFLEFNSYFFWKNINKIFQLCEPNSINSLPCYLIYDYCFIWFLIINLIILFVIFIKYK